MLYGIQGTSYEVSSNADYGVLTVYDHTIDIRNPPEAKI